MWARLSRLEERFKGDMYGSVAMLALIERHSKVVMDGLEGVFLFARRISTRGTGAEARNVDLETTKVIWESWIRVSY